MEWKTMICKVKGCNSDTEFDIDEWCNFHWKLRLIRGESE